MADELDREIERAFEIGKDNEEVIQLAHNWCGHLKVVKSGGTGLIEVQTGLPIGMRHFECQHAVAGGFAGMVMRDIVLDFYDRNCVGCKYRVAVRLPNLSQLAGERDERNKRARDAQAKSLPRFEGCNREADGTSYETLDWEQPTNARDLRGNRQVRPGTFAAKWGSSPANRKRPRNLTSHCQSTTRSGILRNLRGI